MTRHIAGGSSSPFFDAEFAARVSPRKKQAVYRPSRNRAKLAAVEALAERWLNATHPEDGLPLVISQAFGQELLDTLNNAGEPNGLNSAAPLIQGGDRVRVKCGDYAGRIGNVLTTTHIENEVSTAEIGLDPDGARVTITVPNLERLGRKE